MNIFCKYQVDQLINTAVIKVLGNDWLLNVRESEKSTEGIRRKKNIEIKNIKYTCIKE